jgi:oligopeptide/dipeptide ABC transporter ATP-binding protein
MAPIASAETAHAHQSRARGSETGRPLLVAEGLVKHFPLRSGPRRHRGAAVHAVDDVSLTIHEGEALGVVGETGSGKSTLARLILRLIQPDSGRVVFDGLDVLNAGREQLKAARRQMQIVFQDPVGALDPRMKIGTSLMAPLSQHRLLSRSEREARMAELLTTVGLNPSFAERYPSECSGGELQRIVIARALSLGPRLLICDEPTASLDASNRAQILNVLDDLRRRFSLSMLMISHDLRLVSYMCERIAVMYLGQIVEIGDGREVFERPLHPYTRKLMEASLLERKTFASEEAIIEGEPPSPIRPPAGCRFNPRCPIATDRCRAEPPALLEVEPGHWVSCFYWATQASLPRVPHNSGSSSAVPA